MAADYNTKINFHYSSKHMIHEKDVYPPLLELIKKVMGKCYLSILMMSVFQKKNLSG